MEAKPLLEIAAILGVVETILIIIERILKLLERVQKLEKKKLRRSLFFVMGTIGFVLLSIFAFAAVQEYLPFPMQRCKYVECAAVKQPGMKNLLPIVVSDFRQVPPERDFAAENEIRQEISRRGFLARDNFFKQPFAKQGHFFDIYSGNSGILKKLKVDELVDYLMLAEKHKEFTEEKGHPIPFTCRAQLIYKILSSGGVLEKSGSISAEGSGTTQASAEEMADERLANEIGQILGSP